MDNDRDKDLNNDSESSGSWDNEPSRSQPGDMKGDKGRSSNIESDIESDGGSSESGNVIRRPSPSEMEH